MKKLLLFISTLLFINLFSIAQDLPNGSFESWDDMGTYENPTDWTTPNDFSSLVNIFTVTKEATDVYDGSFAARLETKFIAVMNVPGLITLGEISVDIPSQTYDLFGGIPFTGRPDKVKGWYKYTPAGPDACFAYTVFTKFNGATTDTIGFGLFTSMETIDTWTQFESNITYFAAIDPDTMNITILSSSITAAQVGSVMLVDKMELDYGVGINENLIQANTDIYFDQPNRQVHIKYGFDEPKTVDVTLLNIMGQAVMQLPSEVVTKEQNTLSLPELQGGIYLLEVRSEGERMVKKIIL